MYLSAIQKCIEGGYHGVLKMIDFMSCSFWCTKIYSGGNHGVLNIIDFMSCS